MSPLYLNLTNKKTPFAQEGPMMANTDPTTDHGIPAQPKINLPAKQAKVLSGAEPLLDGNEHIGISVQVTSGGGLANLMIPDVNKVKDGSPVYLTNRIELNGKNLKEFLTAKGVALPDQIEALLIDTAISCEAFYYTTNEKGPLLVMFAVQFEKGLINSLTGSEDLGKLFDIKGGSIRVLKCEQGDFDKLQKYAAELTT
jgi:hypothetical protein